MSAVLNIDSKKYDSGLKSAKKNALDAKSTLASLTDEIKSGGGALDISADKFRSLESELSSVRVGLQTTKSEITAVSSEFIGAERSTDALSAQNKVLEKYTYDLNDQLRVQKELLENAASAYGEADARTQKYKQALNNTVAELNKTNSQIKENTEQIKLNASQNSGLNGILGKVGINVGDLAKKFGASSETAGKLTAALGSGAAVAGTFAVAIGGVTSKLSAFADEQALRIDNINTLARNYHMASQEMQMLDYMSKLIDVDTQAITGSMSRLTRSMESAKDGTGDAAETFYRLGVNITNADGTLRESGEVYLDTIDAIREMRNETEQDAIAMQIFGRSAMELRGVIDAGSDGLRAYAEEARSLGVVLSDEANARLQAYQDAKDKSDYAYETLKANLGALIAPVKEFGAEIKLGFFALANDAVSALQSFGESADKTSDSVRNLADSIRALDGTELKLGSIRDLDRTNPVDILPKKDAEYVQYLRNMRSEQERLGAQLYTMTPDAWSRAYDQAHQTQTTVNVNISGKTVAQASYDDLQRIGAIRGGGIR